MKVEVAVLHFFAHALVRKEGSGVSIDVNASVHLKQITVSN